MNKGAEPTPPPSVPESRPEPAGQPPKTCWWKHPLVWISGLALIARLAVLPLGVPYEYDTKYYRQIASNLLEGRGYTLDGVNPEIYWMPGTVLLHVLAQSIQPSLMATRLLWILLGIGLTAVAYGLAECWAGRRVAILFAAFMAVYPYNLIWGNYATSEIPNLILLMGTAWLLLHRANPVAVGVCFAVACLFRAPDLAYLPLVLLGGAVWAGGAMVARFKRAGLVLLTFIVCVAPWSIRASVCARTFVPLSAGGLQNVWLGTNPWYASWIRGEMSEEDYKAHIYKDCAFDAPYAEKNRVFGRSIKDYIRNNPAQFISLMGYKTFRFFLVPPGWSNEKDRRNRMPWLVRWVGISYLAVIAGVAGALWTAWRRRCWTRLAPLLLWILFGFAANIWFDAVVAYRLKTGVETCFLLLAAWFLTGLFTGTNQRGQVSLGARSAGSN